ncbi:uncharacterized protein LOC111907886 [Lactuca sativa]|uniref:uncharacterized protein LOC111907886 n=1 Tax=Lactuca sativa TaxID=4236 RepID=UPI000CD9428B|nr:uncharacterized protein LOC111907886 [Lactuca sativa]
MAKDFNEFIAKAGLMEFNTGCYKFTYKCDDGLKLSKLDRILVCSNFIAMQTMSTVNVLDREYSDHAPVVLKPSCQDFGPPSFRFFNSWMLRDGFNEEFENAWNSFMGFGSPDMFIKARLKHVKNRIRKWRQVDSNDESKLLLNSKTKVAELESIVEFRALTEDELLERRKCKTKISELEKFAKLDMQQKAKVKWLTDGDENTAFFHGSVKSKNQKNRIHEWPDRPKLISNLFKSLSSEHVRLLDASFTFEEVKHAVWSCGGEKAPGPDGYTFKILRSKWDLIKSDVFHFVKHFESHGSLARGCNS